MNKDQKKIIISVIGGIAFIALIIMLGLFLKNKISDGNSGKSDGNKEELVSDTVDGVEEGSGDYTADIDVAGYGVITVELDKKNAPISVENFVKLAKEGFYDGLTFHRIISGFMIQGGDPNGDGTGGSKDTIKGEFSANGVDNPLSHTRGAISMARSSENDSASSQFFIVHQDSQGLDGQYAVFGYTSRGMNIVDKICEDANPTDGNGSIAKDKQPVINSIKIR